MNRALTIPGALAVLVAAPFIIAIPGKDKEPPAPPKPVEASVTVQRSEGSTTEHVFLRASGAPPDAKKPAVLVSEDGLDSATATTAMAAECGGEDKLSVTLGTAPAEDWCIKLTDLPAHGAVGGTLAGAGTELALKVQNREDFWGLPIWLMVAGVLAGVFTSLLMPWLTSSVGGARLGLLLSMNDLRGPSERIGGLREWAQARRGEGKASDALIALLQKVVKHGADQSRTARTELTAALKYSPLGAAHPMAKAARREANRRGHKISNFLDVKGEKVPHPADVFKAALTAMKGHKEELDDMQNEMARQLQAHCYPPEVSAARIAWARLDDPEDLPAFEERLNEARHALDLKLGDPMCKNAQAPKREWHPTRALGIFGDADPRDLSDASWSGILVGTLALATVICIVVAVVFAGVTVWIASYEENATFGSWQDEFKLFSAALVSGAAATIVGLLAPWRDTPAAEE